MRTEKEVLDAVEIAMSVIEKSPHLVVGNKQLLVTLVAITKIVLDDKE